MTHIRRFENDDDAYEAWVSSNWGYVLTQPPDRSPMLHESDCLHLGHVEGGHITKRPRLWAPIKYELIDWCKAETGSEPDLCSSCM